MELNSIEEILEKAIAKEQEAFELYEHLQKLSQDESVWEMLKKLAAQERGHKEILENLKKKGVSEKQFKSLGKVSKEAARGIAEYLTPKPISEKMGLQEVVVLAIKREVEAEKFYLTMKERALEEELALVFEKLAGWEHQHKVALEKTFWEITYS